MFQHLLVPTDGSTMSDGTVKRAVRFAKEAGAQITFFYAQESFYGRTDVAPSLNESFAKANADYANAILEEARRQAEEAGVACSTSTSVHPVIYEAIIEAATANHCDLIFMASHGRRGLAGLLLGSETQRVLTHSEIPVLIYREPQ
ncbi:MAG: universal stress protein [Synechococcaceae bacterium WB9_2_170]|nr:universal stress protein [Synechococcaceae bacterium WB9_2_170]